MKIAVASDDQLNLAPHFGRAKGFLLFDTKEGKVISKAFLNNTFTGHSQGHHHHHEGAHHHSHKGVLLALNECQVIISHGMGQKMLIDFQNIGKEVFITTASSAEQAVQLYLQGKLEHKPGQCCKH